jgi:hypothetical protein
MALSNRVLHFSSEQMIWQCHTLFDSENDEGRPAYSTKIPQLINNSAPLPRLSLLHQEANAPFVWWIWVHIYNMRSLSRTSDRVAAFAGMTEIYQKETGDAPVVG